MNIRVCLRHFLRPAYGDMVYYRSLEGYSRFSNDGTLKWVLDMGYGIELARARVV